MEATPNLGPRLVAVMTGEGPGCKHAPHGMDGRGIVEHAHIAPAEVVAWDTCMLVILLSLPDFIVEAL